jgi:outer membrane lipoprotein-sorting protein
MLKKGGELWMYMPSLEKTQKISGHMLRQGMMGSDFSYEDMMETTELTKRYSTVLIGEEMLGDVPCWKLELTANEEDISYPRRLMWVDKDKSIPIKQELFAASGRMVKTWAMGGIEQFDGRWYPTAMRIDNEIEQGSYTIAQFQELKFSVDLADEVFSRRWLER